jgi:hypothetical protein
MDQVQTTFTFVPQTRRGRKKVNVGGAASRCITTEGNIPRISRLMALALRFEGLIDRGEAANYADLARLGHVTRARLTQIMDLTLLAPDIQEDILFLPRTVQGRDPIREKDLRAIVAVPLWKRQREVWQKLAHAEKGLTKIAFV